MVVRNVDTRHQECVRLAEIFRVRLTEMLEGEEFEIRTKGAAVSVFGVGSLRGQSFGIAFGPIWLSRMSRTQKFEAVFDMTSRGLQKFLTKTLRRPWPSKLAVPHIQVTDDAVHMWWGGEDEATATLRMRPILYEEIAHER